MRAIAGWIVGVLLAGLAAPLHAQTIPPPVLLRVFLADGTSLASFGEWARVGDRVVFSIPLDPLSPAPDLHLVSLPADRVDWARTERYAEAARAAHYAATRGEADFAAFTAEVARVLNEVALRADPASRLAAAEEARRALAEWPGRHYGYRAREVREMLGLLDEVLSDLRAAAGQHRFELTLVSDVPQSAEVKLLPPPDQGELAGQLMAAARLAGTPAERQSLLQTLLGLLDRAVDLLPAGLAARLRGEAAALLAEERRLDRAYGALQASALAAAQRYAARADVRSLERLRRAVMREDERLGGRRPETVSTLVAAVEARLDAARRLRLAQDRWRLRVESYRAYRQAVLGTIDALRGAAGSLADIRAQAGPDPDVLHALEARLGREGPRLAAVAPPTELASVHALLESAWQLAVNAVRLRLDAVAAASLEQAAQASASAAGSLLLLARARADLDRALRPPALP